MRFQVGDVPHQETERPAAEGWRRIRSPGAWPGYLLAVLLGLLFYLSEY